MNAPHERSIAIIAAFLRSVKRKIGAYAKRKPVVNCNSKSDSFPKFFKQQKQCG